MICSSCSVVMLLFFEVGGDGVECAEDVAENVFRLGIERNVRINKQAAPLSFSSDCKPFKATGSNAGGQLIEQRNRRFVELEIGLDGGLWRGLLLGFDGADFGTFAPSTISSNHSLALLIPSFMEVIIF
mgnify:CR=1 FL=1